MLRITANHFVAGIDLESNIAAPIIKYMIGWSEKKVINYCKTKNWIVEYTKQNKGENVMGRKFGQAVDGYQDDVKSNLGGRMITDLKAKGELRVFFGRNADIQKYWTVKFPVRVFGEKKKEKGGGTFDFVMVQTFCHPGTDLTNTYNIPDGNKCAYTQLYKYLAASSEIANDEVVLQIPYFNGDKKLFQMYTKAQILGTWKDPDNEKNSYKHNIGKPSGEDYKVNEWIFPVVDLREENKLKLIRLPFKLGCDIFEKVEQGKVESGEEGDPDKNPHLYILKYNEMERNPQKKYGVERRIKELPSPAALHAIDEELETIKFVRPIAPKYLNRLVKDALVDKNIWEQLDIVDKQVFEGSDEELRIAIGVAKKPKADAKDGGTYDDSTDEFDNDKTSQQPVKQASEGKDICACGAEMNGAKFCPNCGAKRVEKQVQATGCIKCGTDVKGAKFCPDCGAKQEAVAQQPPKQEEVKAEKKNPFSKKKAAEVKQEVSGSDEIVTCSECGTKNSITNTECSECGAEINDIPF